MNKKKKSYKIKEVGITKYKELRKIINKAVMGYIHADHYNHPLPITYIDQTLKELEPLLCEGKTIGDVVGVERIAQTVYKSIEGTEVWFKLNGWVDCLPIAQAIANLPLGKK